jgi:acyl-coenzyme A synthetase/AMP-(fatty) acid ligase
MDQTARALLYNDPELGCGNFLFKARELSATKDIPFLFLERPFISPYGEDFESFSYNTLYSTVRSLAEWYVSHGIVKHDVVGTYLSNGIGHFMHYLALNSLGVVPAIINCSLSPATVRTYAKQHRLKAVVVDPDTRFDDAGGVRLIWANDWAPAGNVEWVPGDWPIVDHKPDAPVMICHSSGTTNVPKAIVYTHAQHFIGKRERLKQFIEDANDRLVTGMPPAHSAGISYLMTAVMLELPTFVLSQLTEPSVAKNIQQFKPTIVSGFAQTWTSLAEQGLPAGTFASVRRFYNTGDTPHRKHVAKLLRIAPNARFNDGYGSSELAMAQFERVSTPNDIAGNRCVGRPRWFVQSALIVDAAGKPLPDGEVGYIAIKSPTLTPGYYNQPLLTQLGKLPDGSWLTGDVGYRKDDGTFYQLDRSYDVITTPFGPLYSLATEEMILDEILAVHDAIVIGANRFPLNIQSTVAVIVPERGQTIDPSIVIDTLHGLKPFDRDLPPFALCVAVVEDGSKVPVGCTGKVLKRTLRDTFWEKYSAYLSGDRSVFSRVVWN